MSYRFTSLLLFVLAASVLAVGCGGDDDAADPSSTAPADGSGSDAGASDADDRSPDSFVGLSLEAATARADAQGRDARVVELDGVPQDVEDDLRASRLNFTVVDDVVVEASTDLLLDDPPVGTAVGEYLIGVEVDEALAIIEDQGLVGRVVREDGEELLVTADFVEDRLNLTVEGGVVTAAVTDADLAGG